MFRTLIDRARTLRETRDRGATATEYALLIAVIAIVLIVGGLALGNAINTKLNCTATSVTNGANKCP